MHQNDGEQDAGTKRKKRSVAKSKSTATNLSSQERQVPHPRKVGLHPKVWGYSQLWTSLLEGWTEFQNPTQRRVLKRDCKMHTFSGWWTQPPRNLSLQKRNQEKWTFPNLKLGVKKIWQGNRLLIKQLRGNPVHSANQTAREVQKLKGQNGHTINTCLQPQSTVRKQFSRSSGGSADENMTTLRTIWTWLWLHGATFGIPLFEQQFIMDKTTTKICDTWRIIFGEVGDCCSMKLENWSVNEKESLV